jgi:carboxymethylenebutenolidase
MMPPMRSNSDQTGKQLGRYFRTYFGVTVLSLALTVACNRSGRASHPTPDHPPDVRSARALAGRAETITDEQPHRSVERASIVVGSRQFSLHLPSSSKPPLPSVLVFHSAAGRTDSVLEWCDALARAGFGAVALDFYDGRTASTPAESKTLRDSANSRASELQNVIEQAYDSLQSDSRLRSQQRFLLGWSFGAAWATFASGFLADVKGVIAYYGEDFRMDPSLYDKVRAPILFIGAQKDTEPTPEQLRDIVQKLNSRGNMANLVFVDAMHGFAERSHDGYDPRAARESWEKVLHFLVTHQR